MPIVRKIALLIVVLVLLAPEGSIAQTKQQTTRRTASSIESTRVNQQPTNAQARKNHSPEQRQRQSLTFTFMFPPGTDISSIVRDVLEQVQQQIQKNRERFDQSVPKQISQRPNINKRVNTHAKEGKSLKTPEKPAAPIVPPIPSCMFSKDGIFFVRWQSRKLTRQIELSKMLRFTSGIGELTVRSASNGTKQVSLVLYESGLSKVSNVDFNFTSHQLANFKPVLDTSIIGIVPVQTNGSQFGEPYLADLTIRKKMFSLKIPPQSIDIKFSPVPSDELLLMLRLAVCYNICSCLLWIFCRKQPNPNEQNRSILRKDYTGISIVFSSLHICNVALTLVRILPTLELYRRLDENWIAKQAAWLILLMITFEAINWVLWVSLEIGKRSFSLWMSTLLMFYYIGDLLFDGEWWILLSSLFMLSSQLYERLRKTTYLYDDRLAVWHYGQWLCYALGLLLPSTNCLLVAGDRSKGLQLLLLSIVLVNKTITQGYLLVRPKTFPQ